MKKKYSVNIRHRASPIEDIGLRHDAFIKKQSVIDRQWQIPIDSESAPSEIKGNLISTLELKGILPKGLKGILQYSFRGEDYLKDEAQYDDFYSIDFNPEKVDYTNFVNITLPELIVAFEAYRARVYLVDIAISDWNEIIKKSSDSDKDVDGRDGVYRIYAVNYFDRELCKRAFDLSPEQIVERLESKVEQVRILGDGVYLVYTSRPLDSDELENVDSEVRELMGKKGSG